MFDELRKAVEGFEAHRKEFMKSSTDLLKPGLLGFMTAHPELEAIRWTQYAPHFNDGEPCVFSVNEPIAKLKGAPEPDPDDDDEEDGFVSAWSSDVDPKVIEALKELGATLSAAEEVLDAAFGDGVQVTVTATEIHVDEYEHD